MDSADERSRRWTDDPAPRFWWHHLPGMDFVPPIYSDLTQAEWEIVRDWYAETSRAGEIGECAVPLMSLLHGLVMGNRPSRIVQLGTHAGYSALLLGFMLRRMDVKRGLFTLDIDGRMCAAARDWIERAGLGEYVIVAELDACAPESVPAAVAAQSGEPDLVIIDSSHEFDATLRELDLWYSALAAGGLLVVHDVSEFAENFDVTGSGGVRRAFLEWRARNRGAETMLLNAGARSMDAPRPFYKDACGVGLIHKPLECGGSGEPA